MANNDELRNNLFSFRQVDTNVSKRKMKRITIALLNQNRDSLSRLNCSHDEQILSWIKELFLSLLVRIFPVCQQ